MSPEFPEEIFSRLSLWMVNLCLIYPLSGSVFCIRIRIHEGPHYGSTKVLNTVPIWIRIHNSGWPKFSPTSFLSCMKLCILEPQSGEPEPTFFWLEPEPAFLVYTLKKPRIKQLKLNTLNKLSRYSGPDGFIKPGVVFRKELFPQLTARTTATALFGKNCTDVGAGIGRMVDNRRIHHPVSGNACCGAGAVQSSSYSYDEMVANKKTLNQSLILHTYRYF